MISIVSHAAVPSSVTSTTDTLSMKKFLPGTPGEVLKLVYVVAPDAVNVILSADDVGLPACISPFVGVVPI